MITDFDDLEDLTFGAPRQAPTAPTHTELGGHWDRCAKCAGSGQTRWGVCYACQGKGGKHYKTDFATRAKAKFQREERADRKVAQNQETFAAEHPAEWQWINDRANWELREGDRGDFGQSLQQGIVKFGGLTERQMAAVRTNLAKRDAAREAKKNGTVIDISGLDAAFAVARERKAVKAAIYTKEVVFTLAAMTGANPGAVYAKTHQGTYLGKITGGKFLPVLACTPAHVEQIVEASRDPKAAALRYAEETHRCSICNALLTDPVSQARLMGPKCAQKFGW